MRKLISPHGLSLYLYCPRAFFYYLQGYPRFQPMLPEIRKALEYGRLVHEVISNYYGMLSMYSGEIDARTLGRIITEASAGVLEALDREQKERFKNNLRNFMRFELDRINNKQLEVKPFMVETEIKDEELGVHGIVDVVFKYRDNDKKLMVVDWKTGGVSVMETDAIIQLRIYGLILSRQGYDVEAVLYNLDTGVASRVDNFREVLGLLQEALSDNSYPEMPNRDKCMRCPYYYTCMLKPKELNPLYIRYKLLGVKAF